jgi:hypothetical protein
VPTTPQLPGSPLPPLPPSRSSKVVCTGLLYPNEASLRPSYTLSICKDLPLFLSLFFYHSRTKTDKGLTHCVTSIDSWSWGRRKIWSWGAIRMCSLGDPPQELCVPAPKLDYQC